MTRLPWFPALALPLGVVLLQWHGIVFWQRVTHSDVWGALASGTWEWLALWWWANQAAAERARRQWAATGWLLAAGLMTFLLIFGPLYEVGAPLLAQWRQTQAQASIVNRSDGSLAVLREASMANRKVGQQIVDLTLAANEAETALAGADLGKRALAGLELVLIGFHLAGLIALAVGNVVAIRDPALAAWAANLTRKAVEDGRESRPGFFESDEEGNRYSGRRRNSVGDLLDAARARGVAEDGGARTSMETRLETDWVKSPDVGERTVPAAETGGGNGNARGTDTPGAERYAGSGIYGTSGIDPAGGGAVEPRIGAATRESARLGGTEDFSGNVPGSNAGRDRERGEAAAVSHSGSQGADPLAARVRAVLLALDTQFPGKSDQERALALPAGARDISFLRNHDARMAARAAALAKGDPQAKERYRVISENQLAQMERALGLTRPQPIASVRRMAHVDPL